MAGLFHDFLVLSTIDYTYSDYMKLINSPHALRIHDDIISYVSDSLMWMTCYNPGKRGMPKHKGLNMYGPTIIKADGAEVGWRVFRAWADLFSQGPKVIELTGNYILSEGGKRSGEYKQGLSVSRGRYEKIKVKRDVLVKQFKELAYNFHEVIEGGDEVFMLHLGI